MGLPSAKTGVSIEACASGNAASALTSERKGEPDPIARRDQRRAVAQQRQIRRYRRKAQNGIAVRVRRDQRHAWRFGQNVPRLLGEAGQIATVEESLERDSAADSRKYALICASKYRRTRKRRRSALPLASRS